MGTLALCPPYRTNLWSIRHDLHAIAHLHLRGAIEPVQHAEALGWVIDAGHAVGERFNGVAGLHGDDLDAKRTGGLDLVQRQAAERIDGLARVALALSRFLPGREEIGRASCRERV